MRNLLALIGAAVVLFAGGGWYLGWYTFAVQPGANGKQRIELDVDTAKAAKDVKKMTEAVGNAVQAAADKADKAKPAEPAGFVGPPLPPDFPRPIPPGQASVTTPLPGPGRN